MSQHRRRRRSASVENSSAFEVNSGKYLSQCDPKDVISFGSEKWISISKIKNIIQEGFRTQGITSVTNCISENSILNNIKIWFYQGKECEILRAGSKGWQKGKIKINVTLEFIPDEVEEDTSPLDDIRQADINNAPQQ